MGAMTDTVGGRALGVVALGASAGGIDALMRTVAPLPRELPLALLVVLHIPVSRHSLLPAIIARATALSTGTAADGDRLLSGRILVAPSNRHLLLDAECVHLGEGPKEHGSRPAIDPLFRSLAAHHGRRGAAVVLSGALTDGAEGAAAVAAARGTVLVQDASDAMVPSMPIAALLAVPAAQVATAERIGAAIVAFGEALREEERLHGGTAPSGIVRIARGPA
jgi:two-component system, chemotaxis family, protein-glutamate methylesterase/glutaminase